MNAAAELALSLSEAYPHSALGYRSLRQIIRVDKAIEDSVAQDWFAVDRVVPAVDGDLAGNRRGAVASAVLDQLQQVAPVFWPERRRLNRPAW